MIKFPIIDTSHVKPSPRVVAEEEAAVAAAFAGWGRPFTTIELAAMQGLSCVLTESPACNGHSRPMPVDLKKRPDGSWGVPE